MTGLQEAGVQLTPVEFTLLQQRYDKNHDGKIRFGGTRADMERLMGEDKRKRRR